MKIMEILKFIKYGWIDKEGNKYLGSSGDFINDYILETPEEVEKNKIGLCWDQVELARYYLEKDNIKVKTYFIIYYNDICPTHTFLVYFKHGKYYWVEHAWERFSGIHEYKSLNELILDVKNKYIEYELNEDFDNDKLEIYEYQKPKSHLSVQEFVDYCTSFDRIILESEGYKE